MRLLICTQKVDLNDGVLGFIHRWVEEFAKRFEEVIVICLEKGEFKLPENVKVFSLGKEVNSSRLRYIINFYKFLWLERNSYDVVFVHMIYEYVILGGFFWRLSKKRIGLWYAHGHTPLLLRLAEILSHVIFTSTRSGFRLRSRKLKVVGQGIDTEYFNCSLERKEGIFSIISVGRISPVKDYLTLIKAAKILADAGASFRINIIGKPVRSADGRYFEWLKEKIKNAGLESSFSFLGEVANVRLKGHLCTANLFVNMSQTGSLDKAILEAMAAGLPVLTCNEALSEILEEHQSLLMYTKRNYHQLAGKIEMISDFSQEERQQLGLKLRQIVVRDHHISGLINKIAYDLSPSA
ncbi:MAG: hypothetical protein G01um1014107_34 [Parcubacteria group bacterium Gr01-1014_107]|nr:MAG: hypothetical protein G01um1014107_34 [Parcubacteria group bacterium Gr01-1014_107]